MTTQADGCWLQNKGKYTMKLDTQLLLITFRKRSVVAKMHYEKEYNAAVGRACLRLITTQEQQNSYNLTLSQLYSVRQEASEDFIVCALRAQWKRLSDAVEALELRHEWATMTGVFAEVEARDSATV